MFTLFPNKLQYQALKLCMCTRVFLCDAALKGNATRVAIYKTKPLFHRTVITVRQKHV